LFADGTIPAAFKVTESHVSPDGVVIVSYERAGAITTGTWGSPAKYLLAHAFTRL